MNFADFKSPARLVGTAAAGAFALLPFWSAGLEPGRLRRGTQP